MKYDLAKQLKDAGFPQTSVQPDDCIEGDLDCDSCGSHFAYNPSLSELIEACLATGDTQHGPVWFKLICSNTDPRSSYRGYAVQQENQHLDTVVFHLTPEDAVAKLWLALHSTKPGELVQ
jgi:hypothetical protein